MDSQETSGLGDIDSELEEPEVFGQAGIDSESESPEAFWDRLKPPDQVFDPDNLTIGDDSGDIIDAEIIDEPVKPSQRAKNDDKKKSDEPRAPKSAPPSLDEWMKFFSKIVLRVVCDFYIWYSFRGVDENLLTDREIERLALTDSEKMEIARPFAELSVKSKLMRKHGRVIVASTDSFNALVVLGIWASRVSRIANNHRTTVKTPKQRKDSHSERTRSQEEPRTTEANGTVHGANGGQFPEGFHVFNPHSG